MEWLLLRRFIDLLRIYFLLIVSRNHSNRVKHYSDIRILIDLHRTLFIRNVYFNDMQISRWPNFKDEGHFFTLNFQMAATKICRISLLRTFFLNFFGYICSAPSEMFNVEISWNFDPVVQKNISCFLSDFSRNLFGFFGFAIV